MPEQLVHDLGLRQAACRALFIVASQQGLPVLELSALLALQVGERGEEERALGHEDLLLARHLLLLRQQLLGHLVLVIGLLGDRCRVGVAGKDGGLPRVTTATEWTLGVHSRDSPAQAFATTTSTLRPAMLQYASGGSRRARNPLPLLPLPASRTDRLGRRVKINCEVATLQQLHSRISTHCPELVTLIQLTGSGDHFV